MFESFLIVFRESLEIALITGIILAYLKRIHQGKHINAVYLGIVGGVSVSALVAYIFNLLFIEFEGANEALFEGITMAIAAILLTSMIFWFFKQQSVRSTIEHGVQNFWNRYRGTGIFLIVFLSILREGVETVLFMTSVFLNNPNFLNVTLSGFAGLFAALILGYLIFIVGKKINLRSFFLTSNILLILFAAGLIGHSIHEFEEIGLIPPIIEHIYDINWLINEKGVFGSILKGLFGYNGNPSLMEIAAYLSYIIAVVLSFKKLQKVSIKS